MRALAAIAAALVLAPAAGAARPPLPVTHNGLHVIKLQPAKTKIASCSVHSKTNTAVGKASRKVLPVACEQPPRMNMTGLSGALQAIFGR